MSYKKPGVEITQAQTSITPVYSTPELEACVVGHSYIWVDPALESSIVNTNLTGGSEFQFLLSSVNSKSDVKGDEDLVVVDILGLTGSAIGQVKHLLKDSEFSVNSAVEGTQITCSGTATVSGCTYQVRVGFRAKNDLAEDVYEVVSIDDIKETFGENATWNPVSYGANMALNNSLTSVKVLPVSLPESGTAGVTDIIDAINSHLPQEEVYVIAPMSHKITLSALATHCNTLSAAEEKKERIAFVNNVVGFTKDPKTMTTSEKTTLAESLRDVAAAIKERRVFNIIPDAGYVLESRHISTISPSWIAKSFENTTTLSFDTLNLFAKFASDVEISGVKYKAGTLITTDIWNTIINSGWGGVSGVVTVLVPVPGYYYTAQAAGQVVGTEPSQSLTNVPGSGLAETFGSKDIFSEGLLNVIASGGNWIYVQDTKKGAIYSRHQLSTDMTTVNSKEMSITKAVDYVSKALRTSLAPFIGRYNITPGYLKLLKATINGVGETLKSKGVIYSLTLTKVAQDEINPDTTKIEVRVECFYPGNYINVVLAY